MKDKKELIINGFPLVFFGGVIVFIDFLLILEHGFTIVTVLLGIVGVTLISIYESVIIDYSNKSIKFRTSILFINFGKWQLLSKFDTLELFANHESRRLVGPMLIIPKDTTRNFYEIYLTNNIISQEKVLLKKCKSIPEAQKELEKYSDRLEMNKVDHILENWNKFRRTKRRR